MYQRGLGLVIYNPRQGGLKLGTTENDIHLISSREVKAQVQRQLASPAL